MVHIADVKGAMQPSAIVENRLVSFNRQRDSILSDVHARLIRRYTNPDTRNHLAEILREAAYHEIRRLEKVPAKKRQKALGPWRDLARKVSDLGESQLSAEASRLVKYYCQDIVGNFNPNVYRFVRNIMPPAVSFLLSPVRSVSEGVEAFGRFGRRLQVEGDLGLIRHCFQHGKVIIAPTHSSNMDSIVLGMALVKCGFPPVTYGAGKNLFTNPLISYFMRNLGAYRVDRRLRFRLYKDVLKEYSTVLIERGFHSLFFPGGTRCRSNEVESRLKLGLLGTTAVAYRNLFLAEGASAAPIYVIPATINYRLVLEAETLIEDHLADEGKSRYIIVDDEFSRITRIADFIRKMLAMDESVVVRFGQPMDVVGNRIGDNGMPFDSRGRSAPTHEYFLDSRGNPSADEDREVQYTRRLGDAIGRSFRANTLFSDTHLVSRALFDLGSEMWRTRDVYELMRVAPEDTPTPLRELENRVSALRSRFLAAGALVQDADKPAGQLVREGINAFGVYHRNVAATREGESVYVRDWKLLYYYHNRTAHID